MTEERENEPSVEQDGFEWAIVEVLGHRKHAGRVREEERFGAKMLTHRRARSWRLRREWLANLLLQRGVALFVPALRRSDGDRRQQTL